MAKIEIKKGAALGVAVGIEIDVLFSCEAMDELEKEIGGDFSSIDEWLRSGQDTKTLFKRICKVIEIFANAAVIQENTLIDMGLAPGEKRKFYEKGVFEKILDLNKTAEYLNICMGVINEGTAVAIPDEVEFAEKDEFLEEIEAAKNR